ncbi:MAG TPA: hypothetical protein DIT65_06185 [Cryomorphaceae bacterium]|nr:hypothetical protein [Cryomorphaceae bacterium]|tara:strand:+ start:987 stop:1337 length:351 start_codon:yes stop_codon:yes gene_type:complete
MTLGQSLQFILTALFLLVVYSYKWALHFQYLRVKNRKKSGSWKDFYTRNFINKKDLDWWNESFMILPLLYPTMMTGKKNEDYWLRKIKRTNLVLYFLLIILLLTGIYFSKLSERPF